MENSSNKRKFSPTVWHPAARWAFVLGLCAVAGVIVSYYWRVFYGLDARGVLPLQITGLCVVLAMAAGAAARMETDLALSATGLAGPEGDGLQPVGTVFLGLYAGGKSVCEHHVFPGNRAQVQAEAAERALEMALEWLEANP